MIKSVLIKLSALAIIAGFTFFASEVSGQEHDHDHDHDSDEIHVHDRHNYHLGLGISGAYLTSEQIIAPAIDIHFLRQIGPKRIWGLGIGYEAILKEEMHNNITFMANVHAGKFLALNAGPGFNFGKHEGEMEFSPAIHGEAVLEFDVKRLHIGPVFGFGFDKDDAHFSLGVHLGYGF